MTADEQQEALSEAFPSWLSEYSDCINREIEDLHYGKSDLGKAALEAMSRGKRIRAVLALLWCEALSGDYRKAAPVAVAYELAHAAALVQDDVIDSSDLRRGEKSIVGKYGIPGAILTSNTLVSLVPHLISQCGETGDADFSTLCELLELLGDCYRSATIGEFLDLEMAEKDHVSEADYAEMIRLKTGALIGASSASGALLGSAGMEKDSRKDIVKVAYGFGESLGAAYQIQDDLLDLLGDESVMGKPIFTDIKRGKKSLVLIHFLDRCSPDESKFIKSLFGRLGTYEKWEIEKARKLLLQYDSPAYARRFGSQYIERAVGLVQSIQASKAGERLLQLTNYLAMRKY